MNDELLDMKAVSKFLGLGRDRTYALFREPSFPAIRFNKRAVVFKEDLVQYLKDHRGTTIYL
jgi:predicted DNA-binding transcriptional regulator AlpA